MAYDTINALGHNTYGQMSDVERANFGSQQSAQDFILRKRLQDEALARNEASQLRGETAAERMNAANIASNRELGGTFAEKQAAADAAANRIAAPEMEKLRLMQQYHQEDRGDAAPQRELAAAQLRMRLSAYPQAGANGSPGGMQLDPSTQKRFMEHELGLGQDPEEIFKRSLQQKVSEKMIDMAASETDPAKKSQALKYLHDNGLDQFASIAGTMTPDLATQDIQSTQATQAYQATPNYDLSLQDILKTAQDVRNGRADPSEVVAKRDAMVNELIKRKVDPETAKSIVNQQLDKALPGVFRDILSGISAWNASILSASNRFGNVGAASQTRSALGL